MAGTLILTLQLLLTLATGDLGEDPCCLTKEIQGDTYNFVERNSTATFAPFNCNSDCVYSKSGETTNNRYCFADGMFESVCKVPGQSEAVLLISGTVDGVYDSTNVELLGRCDISDKDVTYGARNIRASIFGKHIYMCGGQKDPGAVDISNRCYTRDRNGAVKPGPNMTTGRVLFSLNTVGSKLVAVGGRFGARTFLDTVEVLEPGTKNSAWKIQPYKINPRRDNHCAVTISSSSIMLIGGYSPNITYFNRTEELNVTTGSVTPYPDLPGSLIFFACSLYQDKIMTTGGKLDDDRTNSVFILDYRVPGSTWMKGPSMRRTRNTHAIAVANGVPHVYSGYGNGTRTMERLIGGKWEETTFPAIRYGSAAVVVSC